MNHDLKKYFNKDNLHHAYLIEGGRTEIIPEIIKILEDFRIKTTGNSDFYQIELDSFKIDDARSLKSFSAEKANTSGKKVFMISANNFLLEAQNSLLKLFEEPIPDTHFFIIIPDKNSLLPTLVSRFYFISTKSGNLDFKQAEQFISMPLYKRIDFIKDLLAETEKEDENGNETVALDSSRARALRFLDGVEASLESKLAENFDLQMCLHQIFKVREFLRQPGSSAKSLMESVALSIPNLKS